MNDDQLKREIEEALSVAPSPQFAARVRARITESPRPSPAWMRGGVAVAGCAVAAVVMAIVLPKPKETAIQEPAAIAITVLEQKAEALPIPAPQEPAIIRSAAQPSATKVAEPEVLIDPREVAGYRKFVEGVQEDRIDLRKLIELQQAAAKTAPIEEIALMPIDDLAPIVIESLTLGPRRNEGGSL